MLSCPDPAAALAVRGEAAEGREVVIVSLRLPKEAAVTFCAENDPKRKKMNNKNKPAIKRDMYSVWRKKEVSVKEVAYPATDEDPLSPQAKWGQGFIIGKGKDALSL